MHCLVKDDESIKKYDVIYDEESIEKLKCEIIQRCSTITHVSENTTCLPDYYDIYHFRNYQQKKVGQTNPNDFYSSPETIYHLEYDYYKFPKLVSLIDRLLKQDESVVNEIMNLDVTSFKNNENNIKDIIKEMQALIPKLEKSSKKNCYLILEKLSDMESAIKEALLNKELNRLQVPETEYYIKLKSLIRLMLVDSINIEDVDKVNKFFGSEEVLINENKQTPLIKKKNYGNRKSKNIL